MLSEGIDLRDRQSTWKLLPESIAPVPGHPFCFRPIPVRVARIRDALSPDVRGLSRAQPKSSRQRANCLLAFAIEPVVGCVRYQLSLSHRAACRGGSTTVSVQTLDKSGVRQESPASGSLLVSDRFQQKARNRAVVGAALKVLCLATTGVPVAFAHTLLLSKEPCQVTLPLRDGGLLSLGFSLMLVKWVMDWTNWPKITENSVASGRAGLRVQEVAPVLVGRQV